MVVLGNTKTNHNYPVTTPERIWVESGMKFLRNLTWQISVRWLRGTIKTITARDSLQRPKQHLIITPSDMFTFCSTTPDNLQCSN